MRHSEKTVKQFIEKAKAVGLSDDYLFLSTLERYETQVEILRRLQEIITNGDTLVTKEYVKGRENLYTNPAITEYNKTTDSANKTVQTLDNLMKSQMAEVLKREKQQDPLMALLGGDANE
jgi:hypothetical protein